MEPLSFSILRWSALVPQNFATQTPAHENLPANSRIEPPLAFLPPLFRRRCTRLSKLGIETAYRCLTPEERTTTPCVFASRFGEVNLSFEIVNVLARGETPSPLHFSLSVHNGVAGLFSIASGNRSSSTAVAAGIHTFSAGLLEAVVSSHALKGSPVFFCMVEEPLPEAWKNFTDEMPSYFGLGLLVKAESTGACSISHSSVSQSPQKNAQIPQGLNFISWLLTDQAGLSFEAEFEKYQFMKPARPFMDTLSSESVRL